LRHQAEAAAISIEKENNLRHHHKNCYHARISMMERRKKWPKRECRAATGNVLNKTHHYK
jgi:hypothetical protein